MKLTIAAIVRGLRDAAKLAVEELPAEFADHTDTTEWEAADLIEEWAILLRAVVAGDPDARRLAAEALDDHKRVIDGMKAHISLLTGRPID